MTEKSLEVRERIVHATAELLARGGREAASTRAVSAAAGVQAPTLYRQFGDMQGLLSAVARETFAAYVRDKSVHETTAAPLEDLRRGWDTHVAFGLANPAVYNLMYGGGADAPALLEGQAILRHLVARVAQAGLLQVSVERATHLIAAAGEGVTLSLIRTPPLERDPHLSLSMREAVLGAVTTAQNAGNASDNSPGPQRTVARAIALHAVLNEAPAVFSEAERALMAEWLERLSTSSPLPRTEP